MRLLAEWPIATPRLCRCVTAWTDRWLWEELAKRHLDPVPESCRQSAGLILNVMAFLRLGLLLAPGSLAWPSRLPGILAAGLLLSVAGEFYQIFCHGRFPSATDIVANSLGALCGAVLQPVRGGTGL